MSQRSFSAEESRLRVAGVARTLSWTRGRLRQILRELRVPAGSDDETDAVSEEDDLAGAIECVITDHLDRAIEALERAAAARRKRPDE
jgi:hypothetical protein